MTVDERNALSGHFGVTKRQTETIGRIKTSRTYVFPDICIPSSALMCQFYLLEESLAK